MAQKRYLTIGDLRGGRNGADAPMSLPDNQCVEALNVDFAEGTLGRKRNGASYYDLTYAAGGTTPTGLIASLCYGSWTYGDVVFGVDTGLTVNWCGSGDTWQRVNLGDAVASYPELMHTVVFNNRTYVAYDSAVDRLHYWTYSSTQDHHTFYRVGLPAPASAPTAANAGGGTQYGNTRYYKVAWLTKSLVDGSIENRSELSSAVTFDPPTTAGPVRVTQPSVPTGENITHWEVYGSTDNLIFRLLGTVDIGTTTYDDAEDPVSYDGDASPPVGANTPPGSWKYLATDGNRLIGGGNWEGGNQSRVWFTPVYGSSDIGDSERVPTVNYIDVDAYDADPITGIVGSFGGNTVVFKGQAIWRLVATGESSAPYRAICVTKALGCIAPKSICVGEDESGAPALYFLSHRGPYRIGSGGLEYVGRDVEDVVATLNQSATVVAHSVWHPKRHQWWLWVATGSNSYPDTRLVLDTHFCRNTSGGVRGGWVKHTGKSCTALCSLMYGSTLRLGNHRVSIVPWVGSSVTNNRILRCDESSVYTDDSTAYQAYVTTKPYALAGLGFNCSVGQSHLTAMAADNVTVTQTISRDFGAETRTATCSLVATGLETRVQRQFEGSDMAGAGVVQFTLGDAEASGQHWTLEALAVPYQTHEER